LQTLKFENKNGSRIKAVMVGVQLPGVTAAEFDSSLDELRRLAKTLGLDVVGRVTQRRSGVASANLLGNGKLQELSQWTGGSGFVPRYEKPGHGKLDGDGDTDTGDEFDDLANEDQNAGEETPDAPVDRATVVLVDHDLSPRQQRNLELATGAEVHDRTSVIIGIFHRHARTREARLQVEIARLRYVAPRLRVSGGAGGRVRGGVGGKGAGESSLELDRRRVRDRIAVLSRELESIDRTSSVRRGRREELPVVALVGYTNAGKSSLMRALTGSEVHVADKLFATLDTTVRTLLPHTEPPILVSDTVGFIKKLPHDLVASFRSTLAEAVHADLILHLVDASDPAHRAHMQVTREALGDVGADLSTAWTVLNKMDLVDGGERAGLLAEHDEAIPISVKRPDDVIALRERILAFFLGELEDEEFVVPWSRHGEIAHLLYEKCRVLGEVHGDAGSHFTVRAAATVLDRIRNRLSAN
jgi:GTP-binding protein HflX